MWKTFNKSASISEAEKALRGWKIAYQKKPDATLVVPGHLDIRKKGLTNLPDLSAVVVLGEFYCGHNEPTSLEGAPRSVRGGYWCDSNRLTTLRGAPCAADFTARTMN